MAAALSGHAERPQVKGQLTGDFVVLLGNGVMQIELQDVVDRARDTLRQSKIRELRKLVVERVGEGISLRGYASTFYHKQLAQELVRKELDGEAVLNHIQVVHLLP